MASPTSLEADTLCVRCGYNLRGLTSDGRCPECGSPVLHSIRGDLLKFAASSWLGHLGFGASLKLWNIGLGILAGMSAGVLVAIGFPMLLLQITGLAGAALGLWASFAITRQEPRVALSEDPRSLRKVIRATAVAACIGNLLQQIEGRGNLPFVFEMLGAVLGLAGLVAMFGELIYLRRLALRIPDPMLAKSTWRLIWAVPVAGACMLAVLGGTWLLSGSGNVVMAGTAPVGGGPMAFSMQPAGPGGAMPAVFMIVAAIGGLMMLILLLWYVRLLAKYRRAFRAAVAYARSEDSTPPAS